MLPLPARSPNLIAFSEHWVKSVKNDCLSKLILFGETSPSRVLHDYLAHYNAERNHQVKGNALLFPTATQAKNRVDGSDRCKERLGGLLKYYHREAA
jgi:putative transposase